MAYKGKWKGKSRYPMNYEPLTLSGSSSRFKATIVSSETTEVWPNSLFLLEGSCFLISVV